MSPIFKNEVTIHATLSMAEWISIIVADLTIRDLSKRIRVTICYVEEESPGFEGKERR
jgi:hypothetical protein